MKKRTKEYIGLFILDMTLIIYGFILGRITAPSKNEKEDEDEE